MLRCHQQPLMESHNDINLSACAINRVPSATLDKNNLVNARHVTCAVPKKQKQKTLSHKHWQVLTCLGRHKEREKEKVYVGFILYEYIRVTMWGLLKYPSLWNLNAAYRVSGLNRIFNEGKKCTLLKTFVKQTTLGHLIWVTSNIKQQ